MLSRRLASPAPHSGLVVSLVALNGLRVSEAIGADIDPSAWPDVAEPRRSPTSAARSSPFLSRLGPRGPSTYLSGSCWRVRSSLDGMRAVWTAMPPGGLSGASPGRRVSPSRSVPIPFGTRSSPLLSTRRPVARRAGGRIPRRSADHHARRPRPRLPGPARHLHRRRLPRRRRPLTTQPQRSGAARRECPDAVAV